MTHWKDEDIRKGSIAETVYLWETLKDLMAGWISGQKKEKNLVSSVPGGSMEQSVVLCHQNGSLQSVYDNN